MPRCGALQKRRLRADAVNVASPDSLKKSVADTIERSITDPIKESSGHAIKQSTGRAIKQSTGYAISESVNQFTALDIGHVPVDDGCSPTEGLSAVPFVTFCVRVNVLSGIGERMWRAFGLRRLESRSRACDDLKGLCQIRTFSESVRQRKLHRVPECLLRSHRTVPRIPVPSTLSKRSFRQFFDCFCHAAISP